MPLPAIVDQDAEGGPLAVFRERCDPDLIWRREERPVAGAVRTGALQGYGMALYWQVGGLERRCWANSGYFRRRSASVHPRNPELAIKRFTEEATDQRLLGVMDRRIGRRRNIWPGADYSIADIATYPWTPGQRQGFLKDVLADSLSSKPAVHRWLKTVGDRPAAKRGMEVPKV